MGMKAKTENKVPPVPPVPTAGTFIKQIVEQTTAKSEKAGDDKILQPKTRDRSIELQALLKSTLESPLVAQLTMGNKKEDAMAVFEYVFDAVLAIYTKTK